MTFSWEQSQQQGSIVNDAIRLGGDNQFDVLLTCPDHILDACLVKFCDGYSDFGIVPFEVGQAAVHCDDWKRAFWLKRLGEAALITGSNEHIKVARFLQPFLANAVEQQFIERGLSVTTLFDRPPEDIELINKHCDTVESPFPQGRLFASGYRFYMVGMTDHDHHWLCGASIEIRQYHQFGQNRDADDVLKWIRMHIGRINMESLTIYELKIVHTAIRACADSYLEQDDLDTAESLYSKALDFSASNGDSRASDQYRLAQIYARQERFRESHDLLTSILSAKDVTDSELQFVAEQFRSHLEVELTGNPDRLVPATAPVMNNFSAPSDFMDKLVRVGRKIKRDEPVADAELEEMVVLFLQTYDAGLESNTDGPIDATMLLMAAKTLADMSDRQVVQRYLPQLESRQNEEQARISSLDHQHLAAIIEYLTQRSSGIALRSAELAEALEFASIDSAESRLDALKSHLAIQFARCRAGATNYKELDPIPHLSQAVSDLKDVFAQRLTPDSLKPAIADAGQLTSFVCGSYFLTHGLDTELQAATDNDPEEDQFFLRVLSHVESTSQLYRFLQHVANWLRVGYREQILAALFRETVHVKDSQFCKESYRLAQELAKPRDVLFDDELINGRNTCAEIVNRLELSRNILLASSTIKSDNEAEYRADLKFVTSDSSVAFMVELPTQEQEPHRLSALLIFDNEHLTLACSSHASHRWQAIYETVKTSQGLPERLRGPLKDNASPEFAKRIDGNVSQMAFSDLTRRNTPLGVTDFPDVDISDSRAPRHSASIENPTISFWGDLRLSVNPGFDVDELQRTVSIAGDTFHYPELPRSYRWPIQQTAMTCLLRHLNAGALKTVIRVEYANNVR